MKTNRRNHNNEITQMYYVLFRLLITTTISILSPEIPILFSLLHFSNPDVNLTFIVVLGYYVKKKFLFCFFGLYKRSRQETFWIHCSMCIPFKIVTTTNQEFNSRDYGDRSFSLVLGDYYSN